MDKLRMRQRWLTGVVVASLAGLTVLGAMPTRSDACEPLRASWVKRELQWFPKLRDLGADGRLPVGRRLVIEQLGAPNKLLVEGGPVGYAFAARSGRITLGWRVSIRLVRLRPGEFGREEETVALRSRRIGMVEMGKAKLIGLRVSPRLGLFRVDLSIRNRKGKFLGRLDRYLFGVARTLDARLDTDRPVYSPGEEVRLEIENIGTQGIRFSASLLIEREVDGQWVRVGRRGRPGEAGERLEGGRIGGCASFRLPGQAPRGAYRAVRSIEIGRTGVERTLTAPFRVE